MNQRTGPSATRAVLFRRKSVEDLVAHGGEGEGGHLKRSLGLGQLTTLSIGTTLSSGIFVVLGQAVPVAGPAVVVSFILAGMIPLSGSSYS